MISRLVSGPHLQILLFVDLFSHPRHDDDNRIPSRQTPIGLLYALDRWRAVDVTSRGEGLVGVGRGHPSKGGEPPETCSLLS